MNRHGDRCGVARILDKILQRFERQQRRMCECQAASQIPDAHALQKRTIREYVRIDRNAVAQQDDPDDGFEFRAGTEQVATID